MRGHQACFAGPAEAAADWLAGYAEAGASHLVLRLVGDQDALLETMAGLRSGIGGE